MGVLSLFCYTTLTHECRRHSWKKIMPTCYSWKSPRVIWFQCAHPTEHSAFPGLLHPVAGQNRAPTPAVPPTCAAGRGQDDAFCRAKGADTVKHHHSFHISPKVSAKHGFRSVPCECNSPCSQARAYLPWFPAEPLAAPPHCLLEIAHSHGHTSSFV